MYIFLCSPSEDSFYASIFVLLPSPSPLSPHHISLKYSETMRVHCREEYRCDVIYGPVRATAFFNSFDTFPSFLNYERKKILLMGVLAKNERGYRRNAKNKRFWSLLILLLSVASIRRKLFKTTHTEERSAHTNSESYNIRLRS